LKQNDEEDSVVKEKKVPINFSQNDLKKKLTFSIASKIPKASQFNENFLLLLNSSRGV